MSLCWVGRCVDGRNRPDTGGSCRRKRPHAGPS
jgi:hypothetical protein